MREAYKSECKPFPPPRSTVGSRLSKLCGVGGGLSSSGLNSGLSSGLSRRGAASSALVGRLEEELSSIRSGGTWKTEYVITSAQDVSIKVEGRSDGILNFCANNYLGLSVISLQINPLSTRLNQVVVSILFIVMLSTGFNQRFNCATGFRATPKLSMPPSPR